MDPLDEVVLAIQEAYDAGSMCWNRHSAQLIDPIGYAINVRIRIRAAKSSPLVKTFLKTIRIWIEWTDRAL
ncbi:hypothetical protein MKX08_004902 [Trichoderma sp. CBMAI-0020]|nr:hypothetical protein MKX08_004902 [Trichoderma sp. CBMAI-0020]